MFTGDFTVLPSFIVHFPNNSYYTCYVPKVRYFSPTKFYPLYATIPAIYLSRSSNFEPSVKLVVLHPTWGFSRGMSTASHEQQCFLQEKGNVRQRPIVLRRFHAFVSGAAPGSRYRVLGAVSDEEHILFLSITDSQPHQRRRLKPVRTIPRG